MGASLAGFYRTKKCTAMRATASKTEVQGSIRKMNGSDASFGLTRISPFAALPTYTKWAVPIRQIHFTGVRNV